MKVAVDMISPDLPIMEAGLTMNSWVLWGRIFGLERQGPKWSRLCVRKHEEWVMQWTVHLIRTSARSYIPSDDCPDMIVGIQYEVDWQYEIFALADRELHRCVMGALKLINKAIIRKAELEQTESETLLA